MIEALKKRCNQFLVHYTYRRRFLFWTFLCLLAFPLPTYWLIKTQNFFIERAELQLNGSQIAGSWLDLFDTLLLDYLQWSSRPTKNETEKVHLSVEEIIKSIKFHYPDSSQNFYGDELFSKGAVKVTSQQAIFSLESLWKQIQDEKTTKDIESINALYIRLISEVLQQIHSLAFDYRIVLQSDVWRYQFAKAIYFSLPQDGLTIAELFILAANRGVQGPFSKEQRQKISIRLEHFKQHLFRTQQLLESAYSMLLVSGEISHSPYGVALEKVLEMHRSNSHFVELIEQAVEQSQKGHALDLFQAKTIVLKAITNIEECRRTTNFVFVKLIGEQQEHYEWQRLLILSILSLFLLCLLGILVFRLLPGHFILLLKYLQEISKGNFHSPLYINPKEEIGQVSMAFHKLGRSIENVITKLQVLSESLSRSIKQIALTINEQAEGVALQKKCLERLEIVTRDICAKSRELAETMNAFTIDHQQQQQENNSSQQAVLMQSKMNFLTQTSSHILNVLTDAQHKLSSTDASVGFMMKVSDRTSMLSLNAAIEVINVGEHKQVFSDITGKIQNFSDMTFTSSHAIKKIMGEIALSIQLGKKTAEKCLKKISTGADRFILVVQQMEKMTFQDTKQTSNYQLVNEMVQIQSKIFDEMVVSLITLSDIVKDNAELVQQQYRTIDKLGDASQKLQMVLHDLIHHNLVETNS